MVTVDVWSSMRLQQVSFAWHRELWLLQMSRLFFANLPKLSAKNVLDAFKEGDKVACDVMAQVGEMLGGTLAMFACVTDPEAIVIGGGVSKAGQPLIDCIQKYYEKYAFYSMQENTDHSCNSRK